MSLFGGVLIGIAISVMLLFNGRVTGVSSIVSGVLLHPIKENLWRVAFILGMLSGGLILRLYNPEIFNNSSGRSMALIALAGFLVGFGTVTGGGCTSGHGVCGVSRLSPRSIIATAVFIFFGMISVSVAKYFIETIK